MGRRTFDQIVSGAALVIAVVLVVAGALLAWAASFANGNVSSQLSDQRITMPSGQGVDSLPEADKAVMAKFAADGKNQMDTGDEAKAYADHYILSHMNSGVVELYEKHKLWDKVGVAPGTPRTYSEMGGDIRKVTEGASEEMLGELQAERTSLFQGNALRGMLLNAYAFGTLGKIAVWASIACFIGAGLLLVLGILGLMHAKKVPANQVA